MKPQCKQEKLRDRNRSCINIADHQLYFLPLLHKYELYDIWVESNQYLLAIMDMERRGIKLNIELLQQNESLSKAYMNLGIKGTSPVTSHASHKILIMLLRLI